MRQAIDTAVPGPDFTKRLYKVHVCIYNPYLKADRIESAALNAYITLVHELCHVSDSIEGLPFKYFEPGSNLVLPIELSWAQRPHEIRAVAAENKARNSLTAAEQSAISQLATAYYAERKRQEARQAARAASPGKKI